MKQSPTKDESTQRRSLRRLLRENLRLARRLLSGRVSAQAAKALKTLSNDFELCLSNGDLQFINNSWYVTHTGLLRLARRKKCSGIHVVAVESLCDSAASRFVLRATVYPSRRSTGFVGYGDADPSNVSPLVHGAEMRVAETRAVNRALRKAYGIGIYSVEELDPLQRIRPQAPNRRRLRKLLGITATETSVVGLSVIASASLYANISSTPRW